jgi:hypothetical protein
VETPAHTVKELAEPIAIEIVLYIAVIRAIENIENSEPDPRVLLFDGQPDFAPDLQIRRNESREPQFISGANKFAMLIDG